MGSLLNRNYRDNTNKRWWNKGISEFNTKELYEIGVLRVSGSGTVHLVY